MQKRLPFVRGGDLHACFNGIFSIQSLPLHVEGQKASLLMVESYIDKFESLHLNNLKFL